MQIDNSTWVHTDNPDYIVSVVFGHHKEIKSLSVTKAPVRKAHVSNADEWVDIEETNVSVGMYSRHFSNSKIPLPGDLAFLEFRQEDIYIKITFNDDNNASLIIARQEPDDVGNPYADGPDPENPDVVVNIERKTTD